MEYLYGTGAAKAYKLWTLDPRLAAVIKELDAFFRANARGYHERYDHEPHEGADFADSSHACFCGYEPTVWYKNPYLAEAVTDIEDQINAGGDATVEVAARDSLTGHAATASFPRASLSWALTETDDD